jgi:limonene-1,2-epoxide hydrolase
VADEQELLSLVESLQDAARRHAIEEIMALFADDAEFELEGLTRLVGKEEIRTIFEYDAGVAGEIELINRVAKDDQVTCQILERNDRLRVAGLDGLYYPSCVLSFKNKLIRSWRAAPDPEATQAFDEFWRPVPQWIVEHYPVDYARLFTPEGRFIRSGSNGRRAVQLAREYRSSLAS